MRLTLETVIEAPAEQVWTHLQTPTLLRHVCHPLLAFQPIDPPHWPDQWAERDYAVSMKAFGLMPLGRQDIRIRKDAPSDWPRTVRDDGRGTLVQRWDHLIEIAPLGESRTRYRDTVDVEAGVLTPFVWAYAAVFYRHRQARWRRLARTGFAALR